MGAEPDDEDLLFVREIRVTYGYIEQQREADEPQKQSDEVRCYGEGSYDKREERTVVIHIEIFFGVGRIEGSTLPGMPEGALEDEEVVAALRLHLGDSSDDGQQGP